MGGFGLYAALALCICGLPATAEERFERWSLEQPGHFIFALSFKRSISFDDRTATSELAFVCDQEKNTLRSCSYRSTVHSPADIRLLLLPSRKSQTDLVRRT
jgi:hypothetical protein